MDKEDLYKQLARKAEKCEELENKIKKLRKNLALEIETNDRYRKALDEIEGIAKNFGSYAAWQEQRINKILDIINKAKGGEDVTF